MQRLDQTKPVAFADGVPSSGIRVADEALDDPGRKPASVNSLWRCRPGAL